MLWSGRETKHVSGVALMIDMLAESPLIEWHAVSDRILTARFNSKSVKMTVVMCYAPKNSADDDGTWLFFL